MARPQTGPRKTRRTMSPDRGRSTSAQREYEEKKRAKSLLMPDSVRDSLQSGPSQMFFLDTLSRHDFMEHELEEFRSKFPNVHDTMYRLFNERKKDNRDLIETTHLYRFVSKEELKKPFCRPPVKTMAWELACVLSTPTWFASWFDLDYKGYTEKLFIALNEFMDENPTTDVMIIFDSKYENEEDIEEVNNFFGVLHLLCTQMPKYDSRLKVIVIFNDSNKFWDKFLSYTEDPETAVVRNVCTAHKFDKKDWLQVWPEKKRAKKNEAKKRVKKNEAQ